MGVVATKVMVVCRIRVIICAQVRDQRKETVQASNGEAYLLIRVRKGVLPSSETLGMGGGSKVEDWTPPPPK